MNRIAVNYLVDNVRIVVIVMAMTFSFSQSVMAAQIYQWKDDAGVVHFSDAPQNVPAKSRLSVRDLNEIPKLQLVGQKPANNSSGRKIWQERCAACHFEQEGMRGKLVGLGKWTVNPQTLFPATPEEMFPRFRRAVNGRSSAMKQVDISDDDLMAVIKYLLKAQK